MDAVTEIAPAAERRMIMAKCTGRRCPMQVGYKVEACDYKDCPYRTEPTTDAARSRAMSDEELSKLLCCTGWTMIEQKECLEWLKQPAEGE